jgi:integrase
VEFLEYLNKQTAVGLRTAKLYDRIIRAYLLEHHITVPEMNEAIKKYPILKSALRHYLSCIGMGELYPLLLKARTRPSMYKGTYLPSEELLKIVNNILDERFRIIGYVQYATGIRASDVLRIRRDWIIRNDDGSLNVRVIGKGDKEHKVFIPVTYGAIIWDYVKLCPQYCYPFISFAIGNPTTIDIETEYHYYWLALKRATIIAGYPKLSTHDLRRNFINDYYKRTKDIIKTKRASGHSKTEDVLRYVDKTVTDEEYEDTVKDIR